MEVAQQKTVNPTYHLAQKMNIKSASYIEIPVKLIFGSMMIGLGDIVVPGLLIAMASRFDSSLNHKFPKSYFTVSFVGYIVGLIVTLV